MIRLRHINQNRNRSAVTTSSGAACAAIAFVALFAWMAPNAAWSDPPNWQTTVVSPLPSAAIGPGPPTPAGMPPDRKAPASGAPAGPTIPAWPAAMPATEPIMMPVPREAAQVRPLPMPPLATMKSSKSAAAGTPSGAPAAKMKVELPGAPAVTDPPVDVPVPVAAKRPAMPTGPDSDLAQQYCVSVGDIASRTRTEAERRSIAEMTDQLDKRIGALEQKIAEHKSWLAKREEFLATAQGSLVRIYSRMKAESAAAQLAAMPEISAAAIVAKMEPKTASSVLADMDPVKAARLTTIMAGAAELPAVSEPSELPR